MKNTTNNPAYILGPLLSEMGYDVNQAAVDAVADELESPTGPQPKQAGIAYSVFVFREQSYDDY